MDKIIIGPNLKLKGYLKRKNRLAKVFLTQHMPLRYWKIKVYRNKRSKTNYSKPSYAWAKNWMAKINLRTIPLKTTNKQEMRR